MTQTIQPRSRAFLCETEKRLNMAMPGNEDNMSLLFSVFDSLNTLYEKLSRLNYVIQKKNMEQIINGNEKAKSLGNSVSIKLNSLDSDHIKAVK